MARKKVNISTVMVRAGLVKETSGYQSETDGWFRATIMASNELGESTAWLEMIIEEDGSGTIMIRRGGKQHRSIVWNAKGDIDGGS